MSSSQSKEVSALIEKFHLLPHPEGGYYTETYRAELQVEFGEAKIKRSASTAIYFLIFPGSCSRLHRITSDEGLFCPNYLKMHNM